MVLNLKNIIVKRIACFILIILIIFSSSYYKKVEAVFVIDDVALLYLGGAIITTMAAAGIISASQTITTADINSLKSSLSDASDDVISGINSLGNSIKNGADYAVTKALASGASVYAVLQAMQSVLFPSISEAYNGDGYIYGIHDGKFLSMNYSDSYVSSVPAYFTVMDSPNTGYILIDTIAHQTNTLYESAVLGILYFDLYDVSTGNKIDNAQNWCYPYSIYIVGSVKHIQWQLPENYINYFTNYGTDVYNETASSLSDLPSISIPASVPDVIGSSIDAYQNGETEDLIITLPTDYVLPSDLIIVEPDTVAETGEGTDTVEDGTIIDTITTSIADLINSITDGITNITDTITGDVTEEINTEKLEGLNALIFDKFPFCIPFDVYHFFQLLDADPVAPAFTFPFSLPGGYDMDLKIEFSAYEAVGAFIRNINYILFVVFLMYSTKNLIWK